MRVIKTFPNTDEDWPQYIVDTGDRRYCLLLSWSETMLFPVPEDWDGRRLQFDSRDGCQSFPYIPNGSRKRFRENPARYMAEWIL